MMKAFVGGWKIVEDKTREFGTRTDYFFTPSIENAACWETEKIANDECRFFDDHQIVINSSAGGQHICKGFQVEQRSPEEFVIFCYAPFIMPKKSVRREVR